jgi:alpha-amylase
MIPVCLVFTAHLPYRLRAYNYFDVGRRHDYFDAQAMRRRFAGAEQACYGPATARLERLLERHPQFAFSLAISGPLLEQLRALAPQRLFAFRRLVETGRAEPLLGTSHRCLPWAISSAQVERQLRLQRARVGRDLGQEPAVFGGEELRDADALAAIGESIGMTGLLLDGGGPAADPARRRLYRTASREGLPAMVLEKDLVGDLGRRLSDRSSGAWPVTPEQFDGWISDASGDILCLRMDLSILGARQPRGAGILDFLESWVDVALSHREFRFLTPSGAFQTLRVGEARLPDATRTPVANEMQRDALDHLAALEGPVEDGVDGEIAEDFRRLTSADHFGAMTLRPRDGAGEKSDGFDSPYEAYMALRHALSDLQRRLPSAFPKRALSVGPSPA